MWLQQEVWLSCGLSCGYVESVRQVIPHVASGSGATAEVAEMQQQLRALQTAKEQSEKVLRAELEAVQSQRSEEAAAARSVQNGLQKEVAMLMQKLKVTQAAKDATEEALQMQLHQAMQDNAAVRVELESKEQMEQLGPALVSAEAVRGLQLLQASKVDGPAEAEMVRQVPPIPDCCLRTVCV